MKNHAHNTKRKVTRAHHASRIGFGVGCADCENMIRHSHSGNDDEQVDVGGIASGVPNDGGMGNG